MTENKNNKNVLFIMLDQLNYRCLGYMGHPDVKTPNIDALAADGTYFTNFYTTSPICQPSRISFFTGEYQKTHRQYGFEGMVGSRFALLPKVFRQAGYATGASGKFHINSLGGDWGFDYLAATLEEEQDRCRPAEYWYPDYIRAKGYKYPTTQAHGSSLGDSVPDDIEKEEKSGRVHEINVDNYVRCAGRTGIPLEYSIERWTTDKALEFLENKDSEKPFFLWLTYDRPHAPHGVSEPYDKIYDPDKISLLPHETLEQICSKPYDYFAKLKNFFGDDTKLRRVLAAYYSIITCIDDEIGRVVQYLKDKGIYDDTTVIFTADHGDMAGMHGSFEKDNMTEEVIKIPLIIKPACQDSIDIPEKVNEPCESVDIMPSLLSLHNLNKLDISAGRDISGIFKGKKLYEHRSVFSEQYSIKVIIKDGWKLVYYLDKPYGMLFDLNNDPCETTNLYEDDKYRSKRLELKNELIKKLADGWDDQDVEDVENTIFNLGGRSSKVHYGNIGWDQSRFYVVDYRCMYVVEDNPAKYIMMYKLYDDQVLVYPVVNGCPDYTSGDHKKMMIDNGRYEKFVDALADWLICKITPIDVIGVQASELPDAYPDEAEVSKFLSSLSKRESIQKGSVG